MSVVVISEKGSKCTLFDQCRVTVQSSLPRNFFTGDKREK